MKTQILPLFFTTLPLVPFQDILLSPNETRHLTQSRRINTGQPVMIINGQGIRAEGTFGSLTTKKQAMIRISSCQSIDRRLPWVECFFPLIRLPRLEIALEKMTELGIDAIHFYHGHYSIPFSENAFQQKLHRWHSLMIAALKQSGHAYMPELTYSPDLLTAMKLSRTVFWLVPLETHSGQSFHHCLTRACTHLSLACIIGAEGGFSPEEIQWMEQHHCLFADMGPTILRSETAAILISGLLKTLS